MAEQDAKNLLALLNGIARRTYYGEKEITDEMLSNELYPEMKKEAFQQLLHKMSNLMKSIVVSDMDFNQLEAFLTSHTKRKEGGITEDQAKVLVKFWRNHKARIHAAMLKKVTWNKTLTDFSWHIGVQTKSRYANAVDIPIAVLQLQLEDGLLQTSETETLQFEVDEQRLTNVLKSMEEIEAKLYGVSQH